MKLSLGSVQWGLDYGISNNLGKTSEEEVKQILNYAYNSNIKIIDTAPSYGTAEKIIGRLNNLRFQVITKTPKLKTNGDHLEILSELDLSISKSIANLSENNILCVLFHDPTLLKGELGKIIWNRVNEYKESGKIKKIGISIYDEWELENVLSNFKPEIVQLPFNVFDQRFMANGAIKELYQNNIQVHVRSIFLQGLLLLDENNLPNYLIKYSDCFREFSNTVRENGLSKLEACLMFAYKPKEISNVIVGVNNLNQLKNITDIIAKNVKVKFFNFDKLDNDNKALIDPRLWKKN